MLARFVKVDKRGQFKVKSKISSKVNYGTMVFVRVHFVKNASKTLAKACTIAIRYSAVRRQFSKSENQPEEQVLNYQSQQYRLLPLLAAAYAIHFTGQRMMELYFDLASEISESLTNESSKVSEKLAQVHATSSGLKSLTTDLAANGIEECRKCCGGHGYSQMSGLPYLYATYVHKSTAEGDNNMLTQQVARYLFKSIQSQQPQGETVEYLNKYHAGANLNEKCTARTVYDFFDAKVQLAAHQHRTARLIAENVNKPVSQIQIEVAQISHAHSLLTIVSFFVKAYQSLEQGPIQDILKKLCDLFALYHIEQDAVQFIEDEYMSRSQLEFVRSAVRQLLQEIRPQVVSLVDAFAFPDHYLNSALGKYDGRVYEALFDWVKEEPLNKSFVVDGYDQFLRPLIVSRL
jgi:acyl-CoA oxidase